MELIERLEALAELEPVESPCTAGAVQLSCESFEAMTEALREAARELRTAGEYAETLRAAQAEALQRQTERIRQAMEQAQRDRLRARLEEKEG